MRNILLIAGSSIEEEHELLSQLRRYFRDVSRFDDVERDLFSRTTPDILPEFIYQPLSVSKLINTTLLQWAALIVLALLLLFASLYKFNRYDVR